MRSTLRSLYRRPAFALAAILTVALGVGSNTALFSVVYSVLIHPLPFRDPGKLVQIWETHPSLPQLQVTVPDFQDFRDQSRSFQQIAAYTLSAMNTTTLLGQGEPEIVHATMAGSNLFSTMGIRPLAGRAFSDSEEWTRQQVALISEALWRRKYGSDPGVVGRQIRLETQSFHVVGIVPQRQAYPEWADLWIPLSLIEPDLQNRRKFHPLEIIARLKPGVEPEQAQIEIQAIARRLAQAHPDTNATIGAYVTPEYFRVLGIPLKRGRWLSEADRNQPRILINETLARRFFPHQDAVGKHLLLGVMDPKPAATEIVGVVGDVRDLGLDQEVEPTMYGIATGPVTALLVKTAPGASQLAAALRDAIHRVDPEIPITRIQPLEQNVSESLARRRFVLILLAAFGAMAAFLTAAGIYGLLAQSVNARLGELGVRAALGASPGELVAMILREALVLTAPGLVVGVTLSLAFARVMRSFVYQLSPADPLSIAGAAAFLIALAVFSACVPARRAASVDPAVALKTS